MSKRIIGSVLSIIILAALSPAMASAAISQFVVSGKVQGSSFGAPAAADIYAVAPIGSSYTLSFGYDAATVPTTGNAHSSTFADLPVAATFTIGGVAFALPTVNIATGAGPFGGGTRFALFTNAPFTASRLAGYQLLDFSLTLFDASGTALADGKLPTAFDIGDFSSLAVEPRFAFGANGQTRLTLSVDSITAGGAAAVPEPASWMLMIGGFGLIGSGLRRRRAAAA